MNICNDTAHWKRNSEICEAAYDNAVAAAQKYVDAKPTKNIPDLFRKEFNQDEKDALSSKLIDHINDIPKGGRGDYRVPKPEKVKGVKQDKKEDYPVRYCVDEAWKPNADGAKAGTRRMVIVKAIDKNGNPTYIDRIGDSKGDYFSPMMEDGRPYGLRERAIGDYLPEEKIEDNDSYHKYEVKQDFTRANFEAAIDRTYTGAKNIQLKEFLTIYYKDSARTFATRGHNGEEYTFNGDAPDGVKFGVIDNMFGTELCPDGGATQYITPFSAQEMVAIGMLREIRKEDCV